jgi:hypothetical protein
MFLSSIVVTLLLFVICAFLGAGDEIFGAIMFGVLIVFLLLGFGLLH